MILRGSEGGVIAVGQQSHAWISGQLARAWGNEQFGSVTPLEEVWLAALQHDVGMGRWDLAPARNPDSGLPYGFTEMALADHLELWRRGPERLLTQSRYAALLVSMHGCRLYEHRDLSKLSSDDAEAVTEFIVQRQAFHQARLAELRADPVYGELASGELIARNSQLIWTWDFISLALCLDWAPCTSPEVPTAGSPVELELRPTEDPHRVEVDPWPFARATVTVRCEGRHLEATAASDDELAEVLALAPWETIDFELVSR